MKKIANMSLTVEIAPQLTIFLETGTNVVRVNKS